MCKWRERLESELAIDEYIEVVVVLMTKRNCKTGFEASRKVPKKSRRVNRPINGLKSDVSGHTSWPIAALFRCVRKIRERPERASKRIVGKWVQEIEFVGVLSFDFCSPVLGRMNFVCNGWPGMEN